MDDDNRTSKRALNTIIATKGIVWVLKFVLLILVAIVIVMIAPVASGQTVLEHPMTNSQLTGICALFALLFGLGYTYRK